MHRSFQALLVSAIVLSCAAPISAAEPHPNGLSQRPEPGWSVWQPKAKMPMANFTAGFSNIEFGGFLDFEQSCADVLGTSKDKTPYWFRLSNSINRIGTGEAEFGCWKHGTFVSTTTSTAITTKLEDVNCLQVRVPTGDDLRIRAEPGLKARIIGAVRNGATVKPSSFPALILKANQRQWVAIQAPRQGWVSNDRPETPGNLTLCKPTKGR